jgi:hypothetical protein
MSRHERIGFGRRDVRRIARVVRDVERGERDQSPAELPTRDDSTDIVRGTFAAPWSKGTTKTVTHAAMSSQTYEAKNYFSSLSGSGTKACAIACVGGEWILIAAEC